MARANWEREKDSTVRPVHSTLFHFHFLPSVGVCAIVAPNERAQIQMCHIGASVDDVAENIQIEKWLDRLGRPRSLRWESSRRKERKKDFLLG